MDDRQKREYQAVVLGALLHDVGKMLHRGNGEYKGSHEEASLIFLKKFESKLKNNELYDFELVKLVARYHDDTNRDDIEKEKEDYFKNMSEGEKKKHWKFVTIVRDADSYSCAERELTEPRKKGVGRKRAPLDSVFSNVNLELNKEIEKKEFRYHMSLLDPLSNYPESLEKLDEDEYSDIIKSFESDIPNCSVLTKFEDVINTWLNVLEKYTWAVPSDTRYETSDVSLFDHLRSSAAFAACLFKRHITAIEEGKNLNRRKEFIFVGGDFSGIQDYIFDITNIGSGGASKRLRARSFFVSAFSEATIHKILHKLDLPIVCNLFSAGGKFLLIAPNNDGNHKELQSVKTEIEKEIHNTFFNQFTFLMSWVDIEGFRNEFGIYSFFETADKMFHRLETEKLQKSRNVLKGCTDGHWNEEAFKANKLYDEYQESGDCRVCCKGPALPELFIDKFVENNEEKNICVVCYRDKFLIGQRLPKANYVAFAKGTLTEQEKKEKIVIFNGRDNGDAERRESYYIELLENKREADDFYLIYEIGKPNDESCNNDRNIPLKKFYANYVPMEDNKILAFEKIAEFSKWKKDIDGVEKEFGNDLLGVLKVDIDNLGLICSKGFEKPRKGEENLNDIDRKTVSRYLTMARMIEMFFSGWVKEIMSNFDKKHLIDEFSKTEGVDKDRLKKYLIGEQIDFSKIYTVYSGGDDMVLIGPWETMIIFSIFLNMQFRKYTCNNKFITLSAGLNFIKPKLPIASAIKQADSLLEESKKKGKDRITLFGTTIKWDKLSKLVDFFLFLDEKMNDSNSNIKSAFLYRLLEYHNMALSFLDEESKNIEGLKYLSALSYDIGRNIVEWDKDGELKKGHEEQKELQPLLNEKPDEDSLIFNVKVPLFWALYRNRRSRNDNTIIFKKGG